MAGLSRSSGPRLRRFLRYQILRGFFSPLRFLPRPWARAWGAACGLAAWWLLPDLRRRSLRHLTQAFPEWNESARRKTARQVPSWIGRTGADFLRTGGADHERVLSRVAVEGLEHWQAALAMGRGIVAVTGHLGNWELLGSWIATLGRPVWVLYHPFREERLDRRVRDLRERGGVRLLPAPRSGLRGFRALRRGEVVGILIDRVPRGSAVACRFFGRECRATPGAAWFAVRSGAPILPVAMWHEAGGGYRVRFETPLCPAEGAPSAQASVIHLTRRMTAVLEEQIRRVPEQWPWFYDRWKIRPGDVLHE